MRCLVFCFIFPFFYFYFLINLEEICTSDRPIFACFPQRLSEKHYIWTSIALRSCFLCWKDSVNISDSHDFKGLKKKKKKGKNRIEEILECFVFVFFFSLHEFKPDRTSTKSLGSLLYKKEKNLRIKSELLYLPCNWSHIVE